MKYNSLITTIALLIVLTSCAENEFHYLHRYVGKYHFSSTYEMDFQPGIPFEERTFTGTIALGEDGKIAINYDPIYTIQVFVTEAGVISHPAKAADKFWGTFSGKDSLEFNYVYPSSPPSNVLLHCIGVRK